MKTWTKRFIAVLCCVAIVLTSTYISEPRNANAADGADIYDFNGTDFDTSLLDGEGSSDGSSSSIPLHASNLATLLTDASSVPTGFTDSVYGGGCNGSYASVPVSFANPINLNNVTSVKLHVYANGSGVSSDVIRILSANSTSSGYYQLTYENEGGTASTWCEIDITEALKSEKVAKNTDGNLERFIIGYRIYGNSTTCYFDYISIEGEDYFVETADTYDFNGTDFSTALLDSEQSSTSGPLKSSNLATLYTDTNSVPEGFTGSVYGVTSSEYAGVPVCFDKAIDLSKVTSIKLRMYVADYTPDTGKTPQLRILSQNNTGSSDYTQTDYDDAGITFGQWCEVDITEELKSGTITTDDNGHLGRFIIGYRIYGSTTCYFDYISITGTNYFVSDGSDDSDTETTEFTQVTISDFVDSDGNQMAEGAYSHLDTTNLETFHLKNYTSMDNTILSMKVKFGYLDSNTRLDVAGSGANKGLMVYVTEEGKRVTIVADSAHTGVDTYQNYKVWASSTTSVTNFLDHEFLLQLKFEFGEVNSNNKADLALGVYIDGELYGTQTFEGCDMSCFGSYLGLYRQDEASVIMVASYPSDSDSDTEAESKNITISDFVDKSGDVMSAREYSYIDSHIDTFYLKELTSFDNTTLSMRVKFKHDTTDKTYETRIQVAGNATSRGFFIYPNSQGNLYVVANSDYTGVDDSMLIAKGTGDVNSFIGEEFILQVSFEYGNFDSGSSENDIKVGVSINGTEFQYHTFCNCTMSYFGNNLGLYRAKTDGSITVAPIDTEPVVYDFNGTDFDTTVYASEGGVVLKKENLATKFETTDAVPTGYTEGVYGGGSSEYASVPVYFAQAINLSKVLSIKVRMYVPTYSNSGSSAFYVMTNENPHNVSYAEASYEDLGGTFGAWSEVDITDLLKDENTVKDANGYMGRFILAFYMGADTTESITCYFDSIIIDGVDYFVSEEGTFRDITLTKLGTASGYNSTTGVWDVYPVPDSPTNVPGAEGSTTFEAVYEIGGTEYTGTFTRSDNTNGLYITIPEENLSSDADGVIVTIKAGEYAPNNETVAGICITEDYEIYLHTGKMKQYEGETLYEADDEVYVVGEGDDIMIDGASVTTGTEYTTSGVHLVTYSVDGHNYAAHIIIYLFGDMNDDGAISVADLVAMKKYIADDRDVTKAGEKAADMDVDEEASSKDAVLLRKRLVTDSGALVLCPTDGRIVAKADAVAEEFITNYSVGKADSFGTEPITCGRDATVLKWISFEDVTSYTVKLSTKEDMSDAVTYETTDCTLEIMNLLADTDYYWTVTAGDCVSEVQTFHTQDTIRTITIDGVANVRDCGGWETVDGKSVVKQGKFYRGAKIDDITEDGKAVMLDQLGIKMDMDLRESGEEEAGTTSPLGDSVTYLNVSGPYYWDDSHGINAAAFQANLVKEIQAFANEENYPIYVHCSIGRDRTGTICFLINALLGASEEDLYMDYEFSTLSRDRTGTSTATRLTGEVFGAMYEKVKAYAPNGTMAEATEAFMLSIGVSQEDINSIREILLEDK